ncbi:piggyBac transposable element-derived protein 3 [Trichonephila clavipes]|nr:piggyBac transposable element-derived protein 3 [Trichonephila clavipes]
MDVSKCIVPFWYGDTLNQRYSTCDPPSLLSGPGIALCSEKFTAFLPSSLRTSCEAGGRGRESEVPSDYPHKCYFSKLGWKAVKTYCHLHDAHSTAKDKRTIKPFAILNFVSLDQALEKHQKRSHYTSRPIKLLIVKNTCLKGCLIACFKMFDTKEIELDLVKEDNEDVSGELHNGVKGCTSKMESTGLYCSQRISVSPLLCYASAKFYEVREEALESFNNLDSDDSDVEVAVLPPYVSEITDEDEGNKNEINTGDQIMSNEVSECLKNLCDAGKGTSPGTRLVMKLMENFLNFVDSSSYTLHFDNFFIIIDLLKSLSEQGFRSTGIIRENRIIYNHEFPFQESKSMKKNERGKSDFAFDENSEIFLVRWIDNNFVTVDTNFSTLEKILLCEEVKYGDVLENLLKCIVYSSSPHKLSEQFSSFLKKIIVWMEVKSALFRMNSENGVHEPERHSPYS